MARVVQHHNGGSQYIELEQAHEGIFISACEGSETSICIGFSISEANALALDLLDLIERARNDKQETKANG